MKITYYDKHDSGAILAVMFNEVERIKTSITSTLQQTIVNIFRVIISVVLLVIISWEMTLFFLVALPVLTLIIGKIGQSVKRRSHREMESYNSLISSMLEVFNGIRIVRMFNSYNFEINKMNKRNDYYTHCARRNERIKLLSSPITELLVMYLSAVLLLFASTLLYNSNSTLTGDDFIRFLTILALSYQPIKSLSGIYNTIQSGIVSSQRVMTFLDYETELLDKKSVTPVTFNSNIKLENISFKYPNTDKYVLQNVSIDINKGETVAIVGSSGAGKSTILDLIPLFYDITEGTISIDDTLINNENIVSVRSIMSMVTQDNFLFNTSIIDNISYGADDNDLDTIIDCAKIANAHKFISNLPDGYNTIIGERGITISGGQKQRLAIARALYRNTPILIFDEATSALDTESEKQVQEAIDHVSDNRTVIVVAHRLSTVKNADRIIVLHEGKMIEQGSHEYLMKQNGRYRELCEMQFI